LKQALGVTVTVGVIVAVGVIVGVIVAVGVTVGVLVTVGVGVLVGVIVGVIDGVEVIEGVGVIVTVGVIDGVLLGVIDGVGEGEAQTNVLSTIASPLPSSIIVIPLGDNDGTAYIVELEVLNKVCNSLNVYFVVASDPLYRYSPGSRG